MSDKIYPKPTKAATSRAEAHATMAKALRDLLRRTFADRTYTLVIEQEQHRQERLVDNYRAHYGPNSQL